MSHFTMGTGIQLSEGTVNVTAHFPLSFLFNTAIAAGKHDKRQTNIFVQRFFML